MATFAVIETGGKQYKVTAGARIKIEKLDAAAGSMVSFDRVLLRAAEGAIDVGAPYLNRAVEGKAIAHKRAEKKIVFRYHSKTRYRKKKGHRQPYTEVQIVNI